MKKILGEMKRIMLKKEKGIDGILVTIGLCIIALVLCVVMKDSLTGFIESITASMTEKAQDILTGNGTVLITPAIW